jgi:hypothetical protein
VRGATSAAADQVLSTTTGQAILITFIKRFMDPE